MSGPDCVVHCILEECCRSVNYKKNYNGKNCELLPIVPSERPEKNLERDHGYDHYILNEPYRTFNCSCSPCKNGGSCSDDNKRCLCPSGYTRTQCEEDIDECQMKRCHPNAICNNTVGSYSCKCKAGFTGDGFNCTDVNECLEKPCHENATCRNTPGSYRCKCGVGFIGNGLNCTGVLECLRKPYDQNTTCNNTYICRCKAGFTGNGLNCTDINECRNYSFPCHINATCSNTIGSYQCTCKDGFSGDGKNCSDTNECSLASAPCHINATCNNTFGSYQCACKDGFSGDGKNCNDIIECDDYSPCHINATCTNTIGSYQCACKDGFSGDGKNCSDIIECNLSPAPCHVNATCTNTVGSYQCTCKDGYSGNGMNCSAKNCKVLFDNGATKNGTYSIDPDGQGTFNVSCDMKTDGGGWTVFQRRQDGSVDFYRNWTDYRNGFGDTNGEFWLGLENIHRLTKSENQSLRIELEDFELDKTYANYSLFKVGDEANSYNLTVLGYSGTAGDSLNYHNLMKFSTKDRDNDKETQMDCAVSSKAAWWYNCCRNSSLNGVYNVSHFNNTAYNEGIKWKSWRGDEYSLKRSEMKLRSRS